GAGTEREDVVGDQVAGGRVVGVVDLDRVAHGQPIQVLGIGDEHEVAVGRVDLERPGARIHGGHRAVDGVVLAVVVVDLAAVTVVDEVTAAIPGGCRDLDGDALAARR